MSDQEMDVTELETDNDSDDMDEENDDNDDTTNNDDDDDNNDKKSDVYLPGKPLQDGEELVCDQTAYIMLHQAQTGAPCLSFDIIKDNLGDNRQTYPLTAYIVAGTQASQTHSNNIIVMKLSNLHQTNKDQDDDDDDDDESGDDSDDGGGVGKEPKMKGALIKHQGCINRVRSTIVNDKVIVASWSELGRVNLWDITEQLQTVDNEHLLMKYNKENKANTIKPIFTFAGHQKEGFALDWCRTMPGVLASGDCRRDIHIWKPQDGGKWQVDQRPLIGHTDSVEDLQWSPNESNVLASCSVDKSIRVWDIRANPTKANMLTNENCHQNDINVINWNHNEPFLISGGDDGYLHIWDLRRFQSKSPVATFKHHTEPITTVEWHPHDSAVFASGGSDNQIALWDLSVEKDVEQQQQDDDDVDGIPPQLLFIHQGQNNIKELHWHPQIPGVIISTAESGFNIFRTISV